ncbi:MAG: flagellar biosynthetic protein FliR [Deltaproteobacteria bacterium]|nr:flagellar biosynthetic protein FliR [Deltaproteobacteria bacterium]
MGAGAILIGMLYCGARFLPLAVLTPLFGGKNVPAPVRVGLACALGLCAHGRPIEEAAASWSIGAIASELVTGLLAALPVIFVLKGLEVAGHCLDQVCGTNSVEILFPSEDARASPTAQLCGLAFALILFDAGVHTALVSAVAQSFAAAPPGTAPVMGARGLNVLLSTCGAAIGAGVAFGLPFLVLSVGVDAGLNFAGRLTAGFSLAPHAMHVKNALALALMVVLADRIWGAAAPWAPRVIAVVNSLLSPGV